MSAEQQVDAFIAGSLYVPKEMRGLVEWYREYAKERDACVSYPRHKDEEANLVYDLLVEEVAKEVAQ